MLAGHDWRLRHAGLMAIAAIAEGTSKTMQQELEKVIEYVTMLSHQHCFNPTYKSDSLVVPMFNDPHPRVRFAACQCM